MPENTQNSKIAVLRQDWLISVPVWGDRYINVFEKVGWPYLKRAIEALRANCGVIIHTDQPDRLRAIVGPYLAHIEGVPGPDKSFYSLSNAHKQLLHSAKPGKRLVFLTADLLVSQNSLKNAANHIHSGFKVICCAGMRALEEDLPPIFDTGSELLSWGWDHRHPMTEECTWPNGRSMDCSRLYFQKDNNVNCVLTLPHPMVVVAPSGHVNFYPTIDVNLTSNFQSGKIHLATNPDDVSMIELSPKDKEFVKTDSMLSRYNSGQNANPSFIKLSHTNHRHFVGHTIIIKGTGEDCGNSIVQKRWLNGA